MDHLVAHITDLYQQVGHDRFSMVVASRHASSSGVGSQTSSTATAPRVTWRTSAHFAIR